jgi:hypothetical protein
VGGIVNNALSLTEFSFGQYSAFASITGKDGIQTLSKLAAIGVLHDEAYECGVK